MAIFGTKTKEKKVKVVAPARKAREIKDVAGRFSGVLVAPWLTEKALIGTEKGVYVFEIPKTATKTDVAIAVEKTYKVVPRQIRVVNLPAKKVSLRTRRGVGYHAARRKAYVYLTKGDTIQFA